VTSDPWTRTGESVEATVRLDGMGIFRLVAERAGDSWLPMIVHPDGLIRTLGPCADETEALAALGEFLEQARSPTGS